MSFNKKKYQVIRGAISKEVADIAYTYLKLSADADSWMLENNITHPGNKLVGNLYIQKDNSIGLHIHKDNLKFIPKILKEVFKKWRPLPAIKSVRNGKFLMNVASEDHSTASILENFGAKKIQTTYRFDSN